MPGLMSMPMTPDAVLSQHHRQHAQSGLSSAQPRRQFSRASGACACDRPRSSAPHRLDGDLDHGEQVFQPDAGGGRRFCWLNRLQGENGRCSRRLAHLILQTLSVWVNSEMVCVIRRSAHDVASAWSKMAVTLAALVTRATERPQLTPSSMARTKAERHHLPACGAFHRSTNVERTSSSCPQGALPVLPGWACLERRQPSPAPDRCVAPSAWLCSSGPQ